MRVGGCLGQGAGPWQVRAGCGCGAVARACKAARDPPSNRAGERAAGQTGRPGQRGRFDAALRRCSRTQRRWRRRRHQGRLAPDLRPGRHPGVADGSGAGRLLGHLVRPLQAAHAAAREGGPRRQGQGAAGQDRHRQEPRARPAAAHPVGADGLRVRRRPAGDRLRRRPAREPDQGPGRPADRRRRRRGRRRRCSRRRRSRGRARRHPHGRRACSSRSWPRIRPSPRRSAASPAACIAERKFADARAAARRGAQGGRHAMSPSPAPRRPWRWPRRRACWATRPISQARARGRSGRSRGPLPAGHGCCSCAARSRPRWTTCSRS